MSHSVVITRTTTTTSGSGNFIMNTGYLKTLPGLLKLAELILNAICVGIIGYYLNQYTLIRTVSDEVLFFFLMVVTFMIGTFCLLLSCLVSWSTGGIISKTIYELLYHGIAFILLLIASIVLLIEVTNNYNKKQSNYEAHLSASVIGLINSCLYLVSAFLANRQYRGN